ncbi:hypothetical protein EV361DRAFT_153838 [Lentinula raphanica]|nr:hypothetical protein EV361DRAFT_153838 [Lentinula raphanica]
MPTTLSLELQERVIDELAYSFPALKACSQVCRAWLPRCRSHLFRGLVIRPSVYNQGYSNPFLTEYQQIFPCISSCIAYHVRALKLFYEIQPRRIASSSDIPSPLDNALIPTSSTTTIPFPFKRVQSLHICWNAVNWGGITSLEKILQQIDFLRHLVIEGRWRFRVKEDILCCIAVNAPHLKTLSLLRLQWFPSSLGSPIISRIVSSWKEAFVEKGRVPGLKLERFCITESATKGSGVDLMKNVVLPSPCLDFEYLRYLAISANGLLEALGDARFEIFSKQITHLAIVKLDTHMLGFRLNADIFPNLSHIQLDVYEECNLQQFLQNIQINTTPTTSFPPLTHMHINLKKGFMIRENTEKTMFDQGDVLHASNVDSALQRFIVNLAASVHISMHFAQLGEGPEIQRSCIRQVFPRSVLVRQLEWMEPKSLEWWLG